MKSELFSSQKSYKHHSHLSCSAVGFAARVEIGGVQGGGVDGGLDFGGSSGAAGVRVAVGDDLRAAADQLALRGRHQVRGQSGRDLVAIDLYLDQIARERELVRVQHAYARHTEILRVYVLVLYVPNFRITCT